MVAVRLGGVVSSLVGCSAPGCAFWPLGSVVRWPDCAVVRGVADEDSGRRGAGRELAGIGGRLGFPLLLWRSLRAGLHVLTVEGCCLSVESCDYTKNGRWMHRGALGRASHTRKHTAMDEADLRFMRRVPRTRTRCRACTGRTGGCGRRPWGEVCRSPRSVLEGALCRHGRCVSAERGESSNIEPVRHAESRALACA